MMFSRENLLLYAVTDRSWTGKQTLLEQIDDALAGGVTLIQLREKNLADDEFLAEAIKARKLCHRYGVPLIINDNLNVALKSDADGIHVGHDDMPISEIRKTVGEGFIIGATAKTIEQAVSAERDGANYLGVGAVFPSSTKENALRITNDELRAICSAVEIPSVAIGGITLENLSQIKGCGVSGIAVVSAIFAQEDITLAARTLKQAALKIL